MAKKLLFYISTIRGGGAARVLTNLASQFSRNGWQCVFVTNLCEEKEYSLDTTVRRITIDPEAGYQGAISKNYFRIKSLRKVVRAEKPDCIISFMDENNFRAVLATRFLKTKLLVSVRSDPKMRYNTCFKRSLFSLLYRMADTVVFQTEEAKAFFANGIQRKSMVILNQVDAAFFQTKKTGEEYYVAVGRLAKVKNYGMMIRGFAKFLKKFPQEKLLIYGTGELEDELKSLIYDLECTENILLMGHTSDVPGVLSKAKGYFLTSEYEGMPNALLEAMAVGVPSISTDCPCGGPAVVIENGVSGLLVPGGDVDAFAKAIEKLESSELRHTMSAVAKEKAKAFAPEAVFKDWEGCIRQITN